MRIILGKFAVILVALGSASGAQAIIIDMGDYQYDHVTNLAWLDVSLTDNMSVNEALALYPDYRIATEDEFREMFAFFENPFDQFFTDMPVDGTCTLDVDVVGEPGTAVCTALGDNSIWLENNFSAMFGATQEINNEAINSVTTYGFYEDADGILRIGGLSAGDYVDPYFDIGRILFDYETNFDYHRTLPNANAGTFLVRSVPEPGTLALLSVGLAGIGLARRRRKV